MNQTRRPFSGTRPPPASDDASIPVLTDRLGLPPLDFDTTVPLVGPAAPKETSAQTRPPKAGAEPKVRAFHGEPVTVLPLADTDPAPAPAPAPAAPAPTAAMAMPAPGARVAAPRTPVPPAFGAPPSAPAPSPAPARSAAAPAPGVKILGAAPGSAPMAPAVGAAPAPPLQASAGTAFGAATAPAPSAALAARAPAAPGTPTSAAAAAVLGATAAPAATAALPASAVVGATGAAGANASWDRMEGALSAKILRELEQQMPREVEAVVRSHMGGALERVLADLAVEMRRALSASLQTLVARAVHAELERLRNSNRG